MLAGCVDVFPPPNDVKVSGNVRLFRLSETGNVVRPGVLAVCVHVLPLEALQKKTQKTHSTPFSDQFKISVEFGKISNQIGKLLNQFSKISIEFRKIFI